MSDDQASSPPPASKAAAGSSVADKILKRRNKERSQQDKGSAKEKKKKRSRGFGDDEPQISRFEAVASEVRPRSAHLLVLTCLMRVHCREVTKKVMLMTRSVRWRNTTASLLMPSECPGVISLHF